MAAAPSTSGLTSGSSGAPALTAQSTASPATINPTATVAAPTAATVPAPNDISPSASALPLGAIAVPAGGVLVPVEVGGKVIFAWQPVQLQSQPLHPQPQSPLQHQQPLQPLQPLQGGGASGNATHPVPAHAQPQPWTHPAPLLAGPQGFPAAQSPCCALQPKPPPQVCPPHNYVTARAGQIASAASQHFHLTVTGHRRETREMSRWSFGVGAAMTTTAESATAESDSGGSGGGAGGSGKVELSFHEKQQHLLIRADLDGNARFQKDAKSPNESYSEWLCTKCGDTKTFGSADNVWARHTRSSPNRM